MSLLSLLIITLVTWLTLVFLSVADGIERGWIHRLTALHGPLKIIPTESYYDSYYNRIDLYSQASHYKQKNLKEKRLAIEAISFDPMQDEELPDEFPAPIVDANGKQVNLLKTLFEGIQTTKCAAEEYEITGAMLKLKVFSPKTQSLHLVSQAAYLMSIDPISTPLLPLAAPQKTGHTPVFLPKSFLDNGAKLHDIGQLTIFNGLSMSSVEENHLIEVVGFYDAGTMQIGPKCIFAPYQFVTQLASGGQMASIDPVLTSGIRLQVADVADVPTIQKELTQFLEKNQLSDYFNVVPYYEYGFVKEVLASFQSDRLLYSLLAIVVMIVAATNIISVLLLIVHQSKKEIALFTALGANKRHILTIYAGLGFVLGSLGSLMGLILSWATMRQLPFLLQSIRFFKGYENLFSNEIPTTLSTKALLVVLIGTPLIAFIAGCIPAIKANRYKPSELLRLL